jgi:hypothetical protein
MNPKPSPSAKSMRLIKQSLFAVLVLTLANGCTHLRPVSVQQTNLPSAQLLPHHAALVITEEFANYKHEFSAMGDTWVHPYGPALQDYARNVTGRSFQQVDVVPSEEKAISLTSDDLILIPRAVKCDNSVGVWAWEKNNLTLVVEWTAKDRASQNTVWLKTITANASEAGGNAFTQGKHDRIQSQKLFDDLSLKTYNAFQEAPEFRAGQH